MAFIQISDPKLQHQKTLTTPQKEVVVGIDLGTTNCVVATTYGGQLQEGSKTLFFKDSSKNKEQEHTSELIPSVLKLGVEKTQVGLEALIDESEKTNLIHSIKRLVGKSVNDASVQNHPLATLINPTDPITLQTAQGDKNVVELSALMLKHLKKLILEQSKLSENTPVKAVITTPAYFDDTQRQATKQAAQLAGIEVLRIINEPTAAALAYGLESKTDRCFAIYDLGGGTFDFSILKVRGKIFQVLASLGDEALGGNDFNQLIINHLLKAQSLKWSNLSQADQSTLWRAAEKIKHQLSHAGEVEALIELSYHNLEVSFNQKQFEEISQPLLAKTLDLCHQAIQQAQGNYPDLELEGIVLVGGSTRMPMVAEGLKQRFKTTIFKDIDPDRVVAKGASLQADALSHSHQQWLLLDVCPLSLGLEVMGGVVEVIIARNSPIPIQKTQTFTTFKDGQTAFKLHIVQGERDRVKDCRSLGKFSLKNIPPMPAGQARLEVEFRLDADGILVVHAQEKVSGEVLEVFVEPSFGLSSEKIKTMLSKAEKSALEDAKARSLNQAMIKLTHLVKEVKKALNQDNEKSANFSTSFKDWAQLNQALKRAETLIQLEKKEVDSLEQSYKTLNKIANDYAHFRLKQNLTQS